MAKTYAGNKRRTRSDATERKYPQETAEAIEMLGDPLARFEDIAHKCGLPHQTIMILAERLRRRWVPVSQRVKEVTNKELVSRIEDKMSTCLDYMDEVAFASAPLRDLATTFGILHDKRQLLMGQPTQILTVTERKELNELLPEIVKEATRRGIMIDSAPAHPAGDEGISTYVVNDEADMKRVSNKLEPVNRRGNTDASMKIGNIEDRSTYKGQHGG